MNRKILIYFLVICILLSGCGVCVVTVAEGHLCPFGGTEIDIIGVVGGFFSPPFGWLIVPFALADLPVSLVIDLILYPFDMDNPSAKFFPGPC